MVVAVRDVKRVGRFVSIAAGAFTGLWSVREGDFKYPDPFFKG